MTRGDEDIEGALRKFLGTRKGGSEKIRGGGLRKFVYFKPKRREAPKKLNRLRGGLQFHEIWHKNTLGNNWSIEKNEL